MCLADWPHGGRPAFGKNSFEPCRFRPHMYYVCRLAALAGASCCTPQGGELVQRRRRGVRWKDAEAIPLLAAPGPAGTHVAGVPGVNGSALRAARCGDGQHAMHQSVEQRHRLVPPSRP
jgi:hypothetical protein